MNIILIGFMGAGKSSIAKQLAKKLDLEHVEMDKVILKQSGKESINHIFAIEGETGFRELEMAVAKQLRDKTKAVISTGGGVIMNKINIDYLKQQGKVVYLHADLNTITKRLAGDTTRPLMKDQEKAKALYEFRKALYQNYAEVTVITDNKNIEEVVEEIIKHIPSP